MAPTRFLTPRRAGPSGRQVCGLRVRLKMRLLVLWLVCSAPIAGVGAEPPAVERYRELNLVLMVTEGASPDWAAQLTPEPGPADAGRPADGRLEPPVRVRELQTPLNRIVDPRETLLAAARLFLFAQARKADIEAELARIAAGHPDDVAALDLASMAEEALLIRSAIATGIEHLGRDAPPGWQAGLDAYQLKTVYLRNMMEYWSFDRELAAITDQALLDTGTRIEAYRRLLEVDPRLDAFSQHLRAVERIYRQYGREPKPPADPSDELINEASAVD